MKTSGNVLCAVAIGLAAAAVSAQAPQSTARTAITLIEQLTVTTDGGNRIIGTVVDSRRLPIARANLQLRNLQQGGIVQQATANERGEYAFLRVDPGTYVVELSVLGSVVALSDAATLGVGELVQTLIQLTGRWDAERQVVEPEVPSSQFLGRSAAYTMAGETMTSAALMGVTPVDPGEPVSGH